MDEFIDQLLTSDYACDIALPHLPKRWTLEEAKVRSRHSPYLYLYLYLYLFLYRCSTTYKMRYLTTSTTSTMSTMDTAATSSSAYYETL